MSLTEGITITTGARTTAPEAYDPARQTYDIRISKETIRRLTMGESVHSNPLIGPWRVLLWFIPDRAAIPRDMSGEYVPVSRLAVGALNWGLPVVVMASNGEQLRLIPLDGVEGPVARDQAQKMHLARVRSALASVGAFKLATSEGLPMLLEDATAVIPGD